MAETPVGGTARYEPGMSFEPLGPPLEPLGPPLDAPEPEPLMEAEIQPPDIATSQSPEPGVGLFLLAPELWQGGDRTKVERAIARVLLDLDKETAAEALMALTSAMAGIIESEYPLQQWNAVVYDMQVQLQDLLVRRARFYLTQPDTTTETTETP